MAKPWWLSKTIWFNSLMAMVTFAVEILPLLDQFSALGLSQEHEAVARTVLTVVVLVGNALLRTITERPLSIR
ncbi:hypothetical protein [uncultured Ruegeria sp.]|uniref:hypothetical protein n=1 Tax=uncultured Ruegeria sp. TaxID=259304 RepID=UPI00262D1EA0|nr:hypothetical protein [uncultured Ruegeria sp.]